MADKILIIDDDPDLSLAMALRLQASGFRVVTAPDSITALSVTLKEKPDIILLDIGLPGGNGLTFLRKLRSMTVPLIPVVVITAFDSSIEPQARALGIAAFFQKPVDHTELLSVIRNATSPATADEPSVGAVSPDDQEVASVIQGRS